MPPKRKGRAAKGPAAKKAKVAAAKDSSAEPSTVKQAVAALKTADKGKKRQAKVDALCSYANSATIVDDYDCMLNQTNIGHNNNKYYVIQLFQCYGRYYTWNRWGRVGEPGKNKVSIHADLDAAVKDFKKKFTDKTKNQWENRNSFKPVPGKYTMLEMDDEEEEPEKMADKMSKLDQLDGVTAKCKLDARTQELVKLIFDNDMFKNAMAKMEIDVKKMPLGKLSKTQIAKGFEVLEEIEAILKKGSKKGLTELSSKFYTLIPHNFGRQRPPVMDDEEMIRKKMDMLLVLGDIELAQSMQKGDGGDVDLDADEHPHPLDMKYGLLQCDLELVPKTSQEFKLLKTYTDATQCSWYKRELIDIWKVNRHAEGARFKQHDKISNRKLLWHGTNVAVVAAILKGGLRIMPHSGGRVGRGIYLASENSKSAGYVSASADRTGIMFLNEAALGNEHGITVDDHRLTAAPKGFDSIVARGRTEPDPKADTSLKLDGKNVVVPKGKPVNQSRYSSSRFSQSEYLLYKESQCRMRYLLKMKF